MPESTLQLKCELFQVNRMFLRKPLLAQEMVRIEIPPVICAERDGPRSRRSFVPFPCYPTRLCGLLL
jgi:hypothetical protein